MINTRRLSETFEFLTTIDSTSRNEKEIADSLADMMKKMGADIVFDNSAEKTGSNTGNLIARFKGNTSAPPLLLNAHMDTVEPGRGVIPVLKDGIFTSDGSTILGADDKSAIAILLECLYCIQENEMPSGPLEILLTTCEEIGLLGAKHLDYSLITAKYGFALDATDPDGIVTRAPAANRLTFHVHGKSAHAGTSPENGINAIQIAAKAISALQIGRIDTETTCNFGTIKGGTATNIVPDLVTIQGEVRSHNEDKLHQVTDNILQSFNGAVKSFLGETDKNILPKLEYSIENDFSATNIPGDHPAVDLATRAASSLGRKIIPRTSGGGADANIFFRKGIITGVLGTGMKNMHTLQESVSVEDMAYTARLVLEIIRIHACASGSHS